MITQNGVGITSLLNGNTVKRVLSAANEIVNRGVYAATTLSAVDADLAAANIKDGTTIFGFLGTLAVTLAEDVVGSAVFDGTATGTGAFKTNESVGAGSDRDLASVTKTFATPSRAVGAAFFHGTAQTAMTLKLRCYIDGVQVAESAYIPQTTLNVVAVGTKDVSGGVNKITKAAIHNTGVGTFYFTKVSAEDGGIGGGAVAVGAVKGT